MAAVPNLTLTSRKTSEVWRLVDGAHRLCVTARGPPQHPIHLFWSPPPISCCCCCFFCHNFFFFGWMKGLCVCGVDGRHFSLCRPPSAWPLRTRPPVVAASHESCKEPAGLCEAGMHGRRKHVFVMRRWKAIVSVCARKNVPSHENRVCVFFFFNFSVGLSGSDFSHILDFFPRLPYIFNRGFSVPEFCVCERDSS